MARDMSGGYGLSPEGMQIWADWLAAFAVILIDRVDPDEKFSTMRAKVEIVSTPPTEADADPAPVPS